MIWWSIFGFGRFRGQRGNSSLKKRVDELIFNEIEFLCTVGHISHDPCFHKKYRYMEAGVMTFEAHCTVLFRRREELAYDTVISRVVSCAS